jgi:DNA polymerase-3 subunit delta
VPAATPQAVRTQIAKGSAAPVYLIVGDDDAEMTSLTRQLSCLVEDELRAFNLERVYAGEKGVSPASIVESARTFPMMGDRRVVVVLRAERLLKSRRRGRSADSEEDAGDEESEAPSDTDVLTDYLRAPEPRTTLVLVASDINRGTRLYKAIQKAGVVVQCWGLKGSAQDPKKIKSWELERIAREAQALVKAAVEREGHTIEPAAAKLLSVRAGSDIATLRGDLDRLLLFAAGKPAIDLKDVREIVSGETAQDDWAVTSAIQRGHTAEALRQLALALDGGSVPYMILGQLAWFVRERLVESDPRRVPAAVESLFRTDVDLKSSAGDPRVLLERLVVELCRR